MFTQEPRESTPEDPDQGPESAAWLTPAATALSFTTILIQVQAAYHGHATDLLPILIAALLALAGMARKSLRAPLRGSNRRPSLYHLGATRTIEVVDAGHRTMTVIWGRCCAVRLLRFAAAPSSLSMTESRQAWA